MLQTTLAAPIPSQLWSSLGIHRQAHLGKRWILLGLRIPHQPSLTVLGAMLQALSVQTSPVPFHRCQTSSLPPQVRPPLTSYKPDIISESASQLTGTNAGGAIPLWQPSSKWTSGMANTVWQLGWLWCPVVWSKTSPDIAVKGIFQDAMNISIGKLGGKIDIYISRLWVSRLYSIMWVGLLQHLKSKDRFLKKGFSRPQQRKEAGIKELNTLTWDVRVGP